jgi:hypothetical protein
MTSLENVNIVNLCLEYYLDTSKKIFDFNDVLQAFGIIYVGDSFKTNNINILKSAIIFKLVDDSIEINLEVSR